MKKNKFNLEEEYKKSFSYIKNSRNFIYSIIVIFFAFALAGYFITPPAFLSEYILKFIRELVEETKGLSAFELIKFIFLNNLQSSFLGIIFGVLLGFFPLLFAVANGYILGFVASITVKEAGVLTLWRIFPHGIFELPAIFISLGLGLKFGTFVFQKDSTKSFRNYFWNSIRVFLTVVIPLLIIAAIIEGLLIFFVK